MWICLCVQLAIAKNNIIKLQEENQQLRSENTLILLKTQQHLEVHCVTKWTFLNVIFSTKSETEIRSYNPSI